MLLSTVLLLCLQASALTVRSMSDARLWEAVADRAAPLSWPWEDGADAAELSCSNRVTRFVQVFKVTRAEGEVRGSHVQPVSQPGAEAVVDVWLVQKNGLKVLSRESATLAYIPGAGGGPIVVRAKDTRDWERVPAPRVFAFDPAWRGEQGESGYDVAWQKPCGFKLIFR